MNRRTVLACLATLFIAIGAIVAVGGRASAAEPLAPCCPSYTIDIDCSIPPSCFPITVTTYWNGGLVWSSTHATCGIYTVTPSNPPFPPCILNYTNFQYLTINGSPVRVPLNQQMPIPIGSCCYLVLVTPVAPGCIHISIRRC